MAESIRLEMDTETDGATMASASAPDLQVATTSGRAGSPKRANKRRKERKGYAHCAGCEEAKPVGEFDLS